LLTSPSADLYNAGGDPKLAQKQAEADASKASAKIKSEVPGRGKEAEKRAESLAQEASTKFDRASADAKSALKDAEARAKEYKEKTGKEINAAVDKFDATVEKKAAEGKVPRWSAQWRLTCRTAKSGISSWFGGSK
jgi:predicted phage gp36 major capsid-like protein